MEGSPHLVDSEILEYENSQNNYESSDSVETSDEEFEGRRQSHPPRQRNLFGTTTTTNGDISDDE